MSTVLDGLKEAVISTIYVEHNAKNLAKDGEWRWHTIYVDVGGKRYTVTVDPVQEGCS
jgi:hypothetical protein